MPKQQAATDRILTTKSHSAWRNSIFGIFFLCGYAFATWVARLPAVREELALTTADVGILLFAVAIGSIGGLAFAPNILARMGVRRGIATGLVSLGLALAALGAVTDLTSNVPAVILILVFYGFVFSATDVMMNVDGAAVERAVGKTLLPMMHAFFSLGTIVGAVSGAAAARANISVVWNFAAVGLLIILLGLFFVRNVTPLEPAGEKSADGDTAGMSWIQRVFGVFRDGRLMLIGLMVAGLAFAEGSANDWLTIASVDDHHFTEAAGALVFGTFVTAMTAGRFFGGPVIDRFGHKRALVFMGILGLAGIALFIVAPAPWAVFTGALLWGLGGSLGFPVGMSVAAAHPTDGPRRVGIVAIFGYSSMLIGPPVIGFLGEHFGLLNAFILVAVVLFLTLLITPRATNPERAARAAAQRVD
ncbi:MFS transporter [Paeniglutamicibacter kerguelensis]|uniref:MFS family permease n=1 Tax=Paeniglutamicibacter kerguelensis TaxID=254788 RepID=A0ABS4XD83_9MICC|nr:MFS transporter [Paeniglutamicibacter kerguelensis]MBP2386425.1 MFS family permease [Paeniglutamicibacter kerguelensis]